MAQQTTTVRLFAALRDVAGTGLVELPAPTTLPALLAELGDRFGPRFTQRVEVAAVMLDGNPVDAGADVAVPAGSEVALLPPFAGGSGLARSAGHQT